MSAPKRIQRKRTKGWRKPEGAIYVGRGTKWGNPYRVVPDGRFMGETTYTVEVPEVERRHIFIGGEMERDDAAALAIDLYRRRHALIADEAQLADLTGRDLACWCPLDAACHGDVLLEVANS